MKIFVVPHSHIDLEWYWSVDDIRQMLPELFYDSALKVMKNDAGMTFAQDQSFLIDMLIKDADSDTKELIFKLVRDGRLEPVGGTYVQPELVCPSPESLITQIEAGQNFLQENFGHKAEIAWFIDSFGQINQLPQILNLFGFKGYVFMRDVDGDSDPDRFPTDFIAEGADGSRILTHWLKDTYVFCENPNKEYSLKFSTVTVNEKNETTELQKLFSREIGENSVAADTGIVLVLWGDDLYQLKQDTAGIKEQIILAADKAGYHIDSRDIIFSIPSEYFKALHKCEEKLPVKHEEFCTPQYTQDLRGTFISRIHHKIYNRCAENELVALEIFSALINKPNSHRIDFWKPVLFNQFHDLMGGSCLDESYKNAIIRYKDVLSKISSAYDDMITEIGCSKGICVYNPTQFERYELVSIGNNTFSNVHMKPFEIKNILQVDTEASDFISDGTCIENEYYRIQFDEESGDILSILDKELRCNIEGNSFNHIILLDEENPDMEGALKTTGIKKAEGTTCKNFRINKNPYRENAICYKTVNGFDVIKNVSLAKGIKRIDFELEIPDYPGCDGILVADFQCNIPHGRSIYETPFAVRFDGHDLCCAQRWAGISGDDFFAAVLNKGCCGYFLDGKHIGIALLRGYENYTLYRTYGKERHLKVFEDNRTHTELAGEKGHHVFEYSLVSTVPGDVYGVTKSAVLFNNPIKVFESGSESYSSGNIAIKESSPFVKNVQGPFIISRMFSDSQNKIVLRGYNPGTYCGNVRIDFSEIPISICEIDLNGNVVKEFDTKNFLEFDINPFKIITLAIMRKENCR